MRASTCNYVMGDVRQWMGVCVVVVVVVVGVGGDCDEFCKNDLAQ